MNKITREHVDFVARALCRKAGLDPEYPVRVGWDQLWLTPIDVMPSSEVIELPGRLRSDRLVMDQTAPQWVNFRAAAFNWLMVKGPGAAVEEGSPEPEGESQDPQRVKTAALPRKSDDEPPPQQNPVHTQAVLDAIDAVANRLQKVEYHTARIATALYGSRIDAMAALADALSEILQNFPGWEGDDPDADSFADAEKKLMDLIRLFNGTGVELTGHLEKIAPLALSTPPGLQPVPVKPAGKSDQNSRSDIADKVRALGARVKNGQGTPAEIEADANQLAKAILDRSI